MARTKTGKRIEAEAAAQDYELVTVKSLKEHPDNPRKGSEEAIEDSIEHNGWYGAVTVQRSTGYILAGNHRYRVAKRRGASTVPAIVLDVDDERAKRILLADNRTADLGTYDKEALDAALEDLDTLDGTGWNLEAVKEAEESPNGDEPAEVPDDKYEPAFAVIVVCPDEEAQESVYMQLAEADLPEGAEVRVTSV